MYTDIVDLYTDSTNYTTYSINNIADSSYYIADSTSCISFNNNYIAGITSYITDNTYNTRDSIAVNQSEVWKVIIFQNFLMFNLYNTCILASIFQPITIITSTLRRPNCENFYIQKH